MESLRITTRARAGITRVSIGRFVLRGNSTLHRVALVASGFALALLWTALALAATVRVGAETEATAAAAIGLAIGTLPAAFLGARVRREATRLGLLLVSACTALLADRCLAAVGRTAVEFDTAARSLIALAPFTLIVAIGLGPVLLLASVAVIALARDETRRDDRSNPIAWLAAGCALAWIAAPFLLFLSPGTLGATKLAGIVFAGVFALRLGANAGSTAPRDDDRESSFRLADVPLAAALGLLAGRAHAWVDARWLETPASAFLALAGIAGAGMIAAMFARTATPSPIRAFAMAPWFVASFAIGRILPRPPESTAAAFLLLAGVVLLTLVAPLRGRRWRATVVAVCAIAMIGAAATRAPFAGSSCEPDGSHFSIRALPDGRPVAWLAGAPLEVLEVEPYAAARAVGIALCASDAPRRALVLGATGAPFARALEAATTGRVVWVTPLVREASLERDPPGGRLEVVAARERAWLERDAGDWDLIVVAPLSRGPRRFGRLHTHEFARLLAARLSPRGLVCQVFSAGAMTREQVMQQTLPTMGHVSFRCFLDHPGNPSPLLLRIAGPGSRGPLLDRIETGFPSVARRVPALTDADLDAGGVMQCYLFDDAILDLWFDESWRNDDDRPRLASAFHPRPYTDADTRSQTLAALLEKRTSLGESFRELDPSHPDFSRRYSAIQKRMRRDHEAVDAWMRHTIRRAARGEIPLIPGATPSAEDLPALLTAATHSPDLPMIRRPLDRALSTALDTRDLDTAAHVLEVLARVQPERRDVKLRLAEFEARRGRPKRAESIYREILEGDPNHHAARVNLALLLAGFGDDARRTEARAILAAAIDAAHRGVEPLDPLSLRLATVVVAMLDGDFDSARAHAAELPSGVRGMASLRRLDFRRRDDR